ncbi:hypothetical protein K432DRAFT_132256 [Lepidopterella palustris CBS 459.81]|uniref:Uncharacterized protein n=1 Tax=Lepidopterella palustris CBS 459.81 TaxID=1314670 RepID=A0A8E2E443_9PEZI|nr:hypothetical protein K432DRAFT_132256 [Lepidopterella palustris CBS 459.81]
MPVNAIAMHCGSSTASNAERGWPGCCGGCMNVFEDASTHLSSQAGSISGPFAFEKVEIIVAGNVTRDRPVLP